MDLNWKHDHITSNATVITTLDAHAAGEPLRIITGACLNCPAQRC